MQSKDRFSNMRTTRCWMSGILVISFLDLEAHVAGAADAHQRQERGTELRHGESLPDIEYENAAQNPSPAKDLQPMDRRAVKISGEIPEPTLRQEGADLVLVCGEDVVAVLDLGLQLSDPRGRRFWNALQLFLTSRYFLSDAEHVVVVIEPQCFEPPIDRISRRVLGYIHCHCRECGRARYAHER